MPDVFRCLCQTSCHLAVSIFIFLSRGCYKKRSFFVLFHSVFFFSQISRCKKEKKTNDYNKKEKLKYSRPYKKACSIQSFPHYSFFLFVFKFFSH